MRRRTPIVATMLAVAILAVMGTAHAQPTPTTTITGPGTNITSILVGDELGYQVSGFGLSTPQFYGDTAHPGDAGFLVEVNGTVYTPNFGDHGGPSGADPYTLYTTVAHGGVTGTGTVADPFRVTTTVEAGPLQITQVVSFVAGSYSVQFDYTLSNPTGAPVPVRAWALADLQTDGVGFRHVPSGAVGGANAANDFFAVIAPRLPRPSHFEEATYPGLWTRLTNHQDFQDTVCLPTVAPPFDANFDPCFQDNMAGLQWDVTVPAGGSVLISHYWSFGTLPSGTVDCRSSFTDLAGTFGAAEICTMAARAVTSGTTPTTFSPALPVTREQMAVFMIRTWEWYQGRPYDGPVVAGVFTDIAGSFAQTQIEQLAGLGITAGCSASPPLYCPTSSVTRAEMAVFLMRLYESILGPYTGPVGGDAFTDIAGSFAETRIRQLVGLGITAGTSATTYSPNDPVTREQMAVFIIRLMEKLLAG